MILLLDTHLLLWAAYDPDQLSPEAESLVLDRSHTLVFSSASIWEIAIKTSLGRHDFSVNPRILRGSLLEADYQELSITGSHAAEVSDLPSIHKDPFDRLLTAQARQEGITLITSDTTVAAYGPPTQLV